MQSKYIINTMDLLMPYFGLCNKIWDSDWDYGPPCKNARVSFFCGDVAIPHLVKECNSLLLTEAFIWSQRYEIEKN